MNIKTLDSLWMIFDKEFASGQKIPNWTCDKGYFGQPIEFLSIDKERIVIKSTTAKNNQVISKLEMSKVIVNWRLYISGNISRSSFRENSRLSRYIINLLHYLEMKGYKIEIDN